MRRVLPRTVLAASLLLATGALAARTPAPAPSLLEGITVLPEWDSLYAPVDAASSALDLTAVWEDAGRRLVLGGVEIAPRDRAVLPDGTRLVRLRALGRSGDGGPLVSWDTDSRTARVAFGKRALEVRQRHTLTSGITFAAEREALYVPAVEITRSFELDGPGSFGLRQVAPAGRRLLDGTRLVSLSDLSAENSVTWLPEGKGARVEREGRTLWVSRERKRVAISLREQRLRAWEGTRLVLVTNVCTGRPGMSTPRGTFKAGPIKSPMVISRKYGNAEMPWSVQVYRNVFIHGFPSVPRQPSSHGCIRVPLSGGNPARWHYDWITLGTPIEIAPGWPEEITSRTQRLPERKLGEREAPPDTSR